MSKNKHFRKQFIEDNTINTTEETVENQVEGVVNEDVNETTEEDVVLEVLGVVTGCNLLNVRSKPEPNSKVLTVIPIDSVITISDVNASQDFYKVLVGDLEGYCMKKFIKIKE